MLVLTHERQQAPRRALPQPDRRVQPSPRTRTTRVDASRGRSTPGTAPWDALVESHVLGRRTLLHHSRRIRQFSADEILAFVRVFGVPVAFFFLPPVEGVAELRVQTSDDDQGIDAAELLERVFEQQMLSSIHITERLYEIGDGLSREQRDRIAQAYYTSVYRQFQLASRTSVAASDWHTTLRQIADVVERAQKVAVDEFMDPPPEAFELSSPQHPEGD